MPDGIFDLSGKVAFIPGGYGGIGAALAAGLARQGASVAIGGRNAGDWSGRAVATADPGRACPPDRALRPRGHPDQLRRDADRAGAPRSHRRSVRQCVRHQFEGGHVPGSGGRPTPGSVGPRWSPRARAVSPIETRTPRARLFSLHGDESWPRRARAATRHGAGAASDYCQRSCAHVC